MTGNCGGRKHTPIVSKRQGGMFGAEYARRKAGKEGRMPGITTEELASHLREAKGKKLPKRSGRNPLFGNALPFEIGREGGEWFDGCRPSSPSSFKRGK